MPQISKTPSNKASDDTKSHGTKKTALPDYDQLIAACDNGMKQAQKTYAETMSGMDKDHKGYAQQVRALEAKAELLRRKLEEVADGGDFDDTTRANGMEYLKIQKKLFRLYAAKNMAFTKGRHIGDPTPEENAAQAEGDEQDVDNVQSEGTESDEKMDKSLGIRDLVELLIKAQPMKPEAATHPEHGEGHWITVRGHHIFIAKNDEGKPLRQILDVKDKAVSGHLVGKTISADDHMRLLRNLDLEPRRPGRTADEKTNAFAKKLARVRILHKKLPAVLKSIDENLALTDHDRRRVEAAVQALMFKANLRVGNEGSADYGTLGATTLTKESVTIAGDSVQLKFKGKSGVAWDVTVKSAKLAAAMKEYCESAEPNEPIFKYRTPQGLKPVTDSQIRAKLQSEYGFNPHDVRTYAATNIAFNEFKKVQTRVGETLTLKQLKELANTVYEKCGAALQNSPNQCRDNYIAPAVIRDFFENGGRLSLEKVTYEV